MKKIMSCSYLKISLFLSLVLFTSCSKDDDTTADSQESIEVENEVNDFIWRGLNTFYLWKDDVENLADDRFASDDELNSFLNSFNDPEDLFESLLYRRGVIDKFGFSNLIEDASDLISAQIAVTKTNGLHLAIVAVPNSDNVFAYVQYTSPDSNAEYLGVKRGDIIVSANGKQLTKNNFTNLLFGNEDIHTLGFGNIEGTSVIPNNKTVELAKSSHSENPILINNVLEINNERIGYLVYNEFTRDFDEELNDVMADFISQGINHLVLDLRYNPGGDVISSINLASMITGQFTGELFMREEWNTTVSNATDPELFNNYFVDSLIDISNSNSVLINKLNLSEVYILATNSSASASEIMINCLRPYINVIHIGERTFGKYVGSATIFDSPNYTETDVNENHNYAMQPISFKVVNSNGITDYFNGLEPDYQVSEDPTNLGILGNPQEPLLARAISLITGQNSLVSIKQKDNIIDFNVIAESNDFSINGKNMFLEKPNIKLNKQPRLQNK